MKRHYLIAVCIVASAGPTVAADRQIHITDGQKTQVHNWRVQDAAGMMWDIVNGGYVNDGTNDAYDGGMQMIIEGGRYVGHTGTMDKTGREVEIGPWSRSGLHIYRRIYVDGDIGYCRWIDMFENPSDRKITVTVKHSFNLGGSPQMIRSTTGDASVGRKDWAFVTANPSDAHRPAIAHFFATQRAEVVPAVDVRVGNDNMSYATSLTVPPGKAVALCFFELQRRDHAAALALLEKFDIHAELRKIPAPLRKIIVNMGGAMLSLEQIDLPRNEEHDLIVLTNEDELLGEILNERFTVETFFGTLDLPAGQVIGIVSPAPNAPIVHVVLADGQVVSGRLDGGKVNVRLANGNRMSLDVRDVHSAAYRPSAEHPAEIELRRPVLLLRDAQRLIFDPGEVDWAFLSEHGEVRLDPATLAAIYFDTPSAGLHRAVFTNGSVLSGLLTTTRLELATTLGPTLNVRRGRVARIQLPPAEPDPAERATLLLRNDDELHGRLIEPTIRVRTATGTLEVAAGEIAVWERIPEGTLGQCRMKLHDGTVLTGAVENRTVRFAVRPGPELDVFVARVETLSSPKFPEPVTPPTTTTSPSTAPTTQPTTTAPTTRATQPATSQAAGLTTEQIERAVEQAVREQDAEKHEAAVRARQQREALDRAGQRAQAERQAMRRATGRDE